MADGPTFVELPRRLMACIDAGPLAKANVRTIPQAKANASAIFARIVYAGLDVLTSGCDVRPGLGPIRSCALAASPPDRRDRSKMRRVGLGSSVSPAIPFAAQIGPHYRICRICQLCASYRSQPLGLTGAYPNLWAFPHNTDVWCPCALDQMSRRAQQANEGRFWRMSFFHPASSKIVSRKGLCFIAFLR